MGIVLDTYMALATAQRTLHGLKQIAATSDLFGDNQGYRELSPCRSSPTLSRLQSAPRWPGSGSSIRSIESIVTLKSLDVETIQQSNVV